VSDNSITDIGPWSEMKIEIVRAYAAAYARVLASQPFLKFAYVDAFAGAGRHISRTTGMEVQGSPRAVLEVEPAFHEYHFVELDQDRANELEPLKAIRPGRVHIHVGDSNQILPTEILSRFQYNKYWRALLLVDPYSIDLDWKVTSTAGQLRTIDTFINFMVMDANMNALLRNPEKITLQQRQRMTRIWGDDSWLEVMYTREKGLFDDINFVSKQPNETLAKAFRQRLIDNAGFKFAADPLPVHNTKGPLLYYLFFACANNTGYNIAKYLLDKYRN
jgi:three-Cys-motif partner protein